ncbi:MAG TPA: efflux RND transporter periplasmic adaptor subunit [Vicinamibacterales bacterium]|jgi:HlyD family secretion protein|nr:efflux RND transporter periplasmic adaptor subunit [Vicinamibacterales bacterium]
MSRSRVLLVGIVVVAAVGWLATRRGGNEGTLAQVSTVARTASLQSFVTASGEIVATRFADIGSASMGRLVSLSVREGDRVKRGQMLARIDPVQAASSADAAAAGLKALESEAQGATNQIRASQADLVAAEARAADAERQLKRARELRQSGLIAQSDLDTAQATFDTTTAQVRSAEAAIRRIEQAQAAAERRVTQARAEVARARDQLSKTDITAPIDGVVTRLEVEEGEMVVIGVQNQPGTILMTISDLSSINAEVKVAEADVLRLATGNPATTTLEALPGRTFSGEVVEIGASALPQVGTQAAAREFRVKVRIEGDLGVLRPGLTCDAEILVAERTNVLTVPLQAVVQRPGADGTQQVGVFVVENSIANFKPVKTGIIGGLTVEIDGVSEGDEVIAGPFQVLREIQSGARVRTK